MAIKLRHIKWNTEAKIKPNSKEEEDEKAVFVKGWALYETERTRYLTKREIGEFLNDGFGEKVTFVESLVIFKDKVSAKMIQKELLFLKRMREIERTNQYRTW